MPVAVSSLFTIKKELTPSDKKRIELSHIPERGNPCGPASARVRSPPEAFHAVAEGLGSPYSLGTCICLARSTGPMAAPEMQQLGDYGWARHHPGPAAAIVIALVLAGGILTAVRVWDTVPVQEQAGPPDAYVPPRHYLCHRAAGPVTIDGKLDEAAWQAVPWTEDFVDIEGGLRMKPRYRTRAKMLWDDHYFYIAAELEEPHVWGTFTKHDSPIFQEDNDFEVFIDPDGDNHNYAELEINALNTTWDLLLKKPYRDGGPALDEWEIPGLKTAVHVDGTLNDPRDTDRGWTVEIAIPWEVLGKLSPQPVPPRDGDQWRVNFSRVEWRHTVAGGKYRRVKDRREDNWVWSPQGVIEMHRPEKWGYVQFSTAAPGKAVFRPDPAGPARHLLHRVYYAQRALHEKHKRYARTLAELGLAGLSDASLARPVQMELTASGFQATAAVRLAEGGVRRWRIQEDSRIGPLPEEGPLRGR
jgi:hypothetical protein